MGKHVGLWEWERRPVWCVSNDKENLVDDSCYKPLSTRVDDRIHWSSPVFKSYALSYFRNEFVCLDDHSVATSHDDLSNDEPPATSARFVHVEAKCGVLPCSNFVDYGELLCMVCSR